MLNIGEELPGGVLQIEGKIDEIRWTSASKACIYSMVLQHLY